VRPRPTLERSLTRWFSLTLVVLYAIVATAVWLSDARSLNDFASLTLKSEAETVAAYLAARGRLDAPELEHAEEAPFPIWIRVLKGNRLLAATPGTPQVAIEAMGREREVVSIASAEGPNRYMVVRHVVGGGAGRLGSGLSIEAIGSLRSLTSKERRLGAGLLALGVLVLPVAGMIGRRLGRRALSPLAALVADTRSLEAQDNRARLEVPQRAVEEVALLADSFNGVLAQLEQSAERMRRFTADASHEIRNPLSVMRTGLEVALRRERDVAEYKQLLRENLQEIERLQTILEGLLTMARSAPGSEPPIQHVAVDLSALLAETARRFETLATERGNRVELAVEDGLEVLGDGGLLRLIVFNLLDNALKYGPAGTAIRLEAERGGDGVRIRVRDQGPGVPADQRTRVFERYVRDSGSSGVGGLGLAVVRWAAEAHGGRVAILDSAPGATFEVTLPDEAAA